MTHNRKRSYYKPRRTNKSKRAVRSSRHQTKKSKRSAVRRSGRLYAHPKQRSDFDSEFLRFYGKPRRLSPNTYQFPNGVIVKCVNYFSKRNGKMMRECTECIGCKS